MRYSFVSALAFAASVFAVEPTANFDAFATPAKDQNVAAGSTFTIKWEPSTVHPGPVSIVLLQGETPGTLAPGLTIAAALDQTSGSYSWPVPKDLKAFATYGFSITLDSSTVDPTKAIFQYSQPFHITGLSSSASSSSSAAGGTTTVQLSTGPSYTASPLSTSTSTISSSSSSAHVSSSSAVSTTKSATSTYVAATTSAAGNATIITTVKPTTSATSTGSGSSASTTPTTPPTGSASSLFANVGLALFAGLVLALTL